MRQPIHPKVKAFTHQTGYYHLTVSSRSRSYKVARYYGNQTMIYNQQYWLHNYQSDLGRSFFMFIQRVNH